MLNINKIKWLLNEINFLKENKIINDKDGDKLKNYYTEKIHIIKKAKSNLFIKILFFSLGILASLSIVGGITLVVVNFNWRLLSKELKTFLSFLLLVIPQAIAGYILCFKKKESVLLKEIFSIVLSIMFGITIAFIGQIYQLSSDIESFLLTWSISTLFIIYLFNSLSCTVFYLVLIISLSSVMQLNGKIGLVFYPLIAGLIPFYIIEFRKNSIFRIKILDFLSIQKIFRHPPPNLSKEGFYFDKIGADFEMKKGVLSTENLMMRSPVFNGAAQGTLDLPRTWVKADFGVQPLVTLDSLVSKIPIVGYILTGKNKALLVYYFKVEGPLSSPDVKYVPLKNWGNSIMGYITRIFLTPPRLFEKLMHLRKPAEK